MWGLILNVASNGGSGLLSGLQSVFRHLLVLPSSQKLSLSTSVWTKNRKLVQTIAPLGLSFQAEINKTISENIVKRKYIVSQTLKKDWMAAFIRTKFVGKLQ